jgi:predicted nucleic acid-binding protein
MSSQFSPKDLAALPSGGRVFIDANIFIYHFTHTARTAACTKFLQRVEVGDIEGITSVITLAEVAHRLMILEAIQMHGLSPHAAVRKLKENPVLVQQLSHYKVVTDTVPAFNVAVETITSTHLRTAQGLSGAYGLLTNDSLTAAVMQSLALTDLATNDPDFSLVPAITVWQPQP